MKTSHLPPPQHLTWLSSFLPSHHHFGYGTPHLASGGGVPRRFHFWRKHSSPPFIPVCWVTCVHFNLYYGLSLYVSYFTSLQHIIWGVSVCLRYASYSVLSFFLQCSSVHPYPLLLSVCVRLLLPYGTLLDALLCLSLLCLSCLICLFSSCLATFGFIKILD